MKHRGKRQSIWMLAVIFAAGLVMGYGAVGLQNVYADSFSDDAGNYYGIEVIGQDENDPSLYSDGDLKYDLAVSGDTTGVEGEDWDIAVTVGIGDDDTMIDEEDNYISYFRWDQTFEAGVDYTYDEIDHTVTLKGSSIYEKLKGMNEEDRFVVLRAEIVAHNDRTELCAATKWVYVRKAGAEYDLPQDRQLVIGDYGWLDHELEYTVYNSSIPDGDCGYTSVTALTSSDPAIVKVSRDGKDWEYKGLKRGTATLTVTYTDINGKSRTASFVVEVVKESVVVNSIELEGDKDTGLPGESIKLSASASLYTENDVKTEGLEYRWSLGQGAEFADIAVDPADQSKAVVTFKELPGDQDSIDESVEVIFEAVYMNGEGKAVTDRAERYLFVTGSYQELQPLQLEDPYLEPGKSENMTAAVKLYSLEHPEGISPENVRFEWDYNESDLEITGNGPEFTITRKTNDETELMLTATWTVPGEYGDDNVSDIRYYRFEEIKTELGYYDAVFVNANGMREGEHFLNGQEETFTPEIVLKRYGYTLPQDKYKVTYIAYNDFDDEVTVNPPLSILSGKGITNYDVKIEAVKGKGCTGTLYYDLRLCDRFSMHSAEVTIDGQDEWRYVVKPGTTLPQPVVTMNGETLTEGKDYKVVYYDYWKDTEQTEFPTRKGNYYVQVIGLDPYYEVNDEVEVQVGLNNPIRISNKKVTLKYKTLKKKTLKAAPIKATKAVGKVTYKITGATGKAKIKKATKTALKKKKIVINTKTGKVTVKKGLAKGTYCFYVKVKVVGTGAYLDDDYLEKATIVVK